MPTTLLHPPSAPPPGLLTSPLPSLLQTPFGLAIIEIQGSLNISTTTTSGSDDQSIGRIVFPSLPTGVTADESNTKWMKKVQMFIGKNQKLVGEVKKLAKPLGVIRRREQAADVDGGDSNVDELEIVDVVRYKLFFGSRPEFV
jgi:chromosome transmission fidelity protein 8